MPLTQYVFLRWSFIFLSSCRAIITTHPQTCRNTKQVCGSTAAQVHNFFQLFLLCRGTKKNSCSLFAANRNTGASNIYYGLCLLWLPQDLLDAACFLSEEKTVSAQICSQIWSAYILTPVFVGSGSQTRDPKWWAQMNISRVKIKGYSRLQVWQ